MHVIGKALDDEIATAKLASYGVTLDKLSDNQLDTVDIEPGDTTVGQ